ncbi:unnamed protein product, partial [Ascophyllum nodosum]
LLILNTNIKYYSVVIVLYHILCSISCCSCCHPFSFILDVRLVGAPVGVTQEDHTGFLHLPSAVLALIFITRRIQPSLSFVDQEVEFCVPPSRSTTWYHVPPLRSTTPECLPLHTQCNIFPLRLALASPSPCVSKRGVRESSHLWEAVIGHAKGRTCPKETPRPYDSLDAFAAGFVSM